MREVSKAWISYTNQRKQSLEEARNRESQAFAVSLSQIALRPAVSLPRLAPALSSERIANVNYSVPLARMKTLAKALGNISMPYRDVGLKAFDYTYDDIVGDE